LPLITRRRYHAQTGRITRDPQRFTPFFETAKKLLGTQ
jgi:hypothetical protein